jgi:hypothetical protein
MNDILNKICDACFVAPEIRLGQVHCVYASCPQLKQRPSLFQKKSFVSAAGIPLSWKIECDAMTNEDWQTIADICAPKMDQFFSVMSVPTGGNKLAQAFYKHITPKARVVLFVDDVWTTGHSMLCRIDQFSRVKTPREEVRGFVAFARCQSLPAWVDCFMLTKW